MKNIYILLLSLFTVVGFSQKTLKVFNFSSKTVNINMIVTKPNAGTFPWYASTYTNNGTNTISIAPGGSYILTNTADLFKFPFLSTTSVPQITTWRKVNAPAAGSSNSTFTPVSSNVAWALGGAQIFDYIDFGVFNGTFYQGGGKMGVIGQYVTGPSLTSQPQGNWKVTYVGMGSGNLIEYTVTFTNN